jgi:magnesium transporter
MVRSARRARHRDAAPSARAVARAAFGVRLPRIRRNHPGSAAGLELRDLSALPSEPGGTLITVIDYGPEKVETRTIDHLEGFLAEHRPEWSVVRWINVDGLRDMRVIEGFAKKYELHPLAVEDVLHVPQRPKVEAFGGADPSGAGPPGRLFVIAKMLQIEDGRLTSEQVSFFVGHRTVITFQERRGDVWDPIRRRINTPGSQIVTNDASFLLYALLDAIVDHGFPILESYGDRLEEIEEQVLSRPDETVIEQIHRLRRELLLFRREVWPMREVINTLHREPHECMSETTRTYLRDVYDHTVQIIDLCETYREFGTGMTETYMSSLSIRMNEVMKVLTIIATIFIPITFLAGVYGMNFRRIPELDWRYGYPAFWSVCAIVALGMLAWFKRKQWL